MNNADMPAMPTTFYEEPRRPAKPGVYDRRTVGGLTKREHFAGMAMQGLYAGTLADGSVVADSSYVILAEASVKAADALLAELEKQS